MSSDLPEGFIMALADNLDATAYFASLSQSHQNTIVDHARHVNSKQEMRQYVNSFFKS